MHPLRLLLYGSVLLAAVVAWALGAALLNGGMKESAAMTAGVLAFVTFMLPWTGVYLWAMRRASGLEALIERTRKVEPIERVYHGELDDLAREIVDALGEGLLAVTAEGRVAFANRRVGEMFGAREILVGRSVLEVVRKRSVAAALEKALHGDASTDRVEYDERQIEIRAFPVAASPDIAAVALFIDVTH